MTESLLVRTARRAASLTWDGLAPAVQELAPLVLLDALGCGRVGARLGVHGPWIRQIVAAGGPAQATVWASGERLPASHAALVNGTFAHHVEMDDGNGRASLHGGVTVVPAALAMAEHLGASGRATLEAIVAGYEAAIALGRPLLPGIGLHRLHPPSIVGCFGAAAAAGRLLGLDEMALAGALSLTATLVPMGPFEVFTRGGPVKDLYGGWPAFIGVQAALLARAGLAGPLDLFEAAGDGMGASYLHQTLNTEAFGPDPEELLHVHFKTFSTCRSVQPTLTAVERLGPPGSLDLDEIAKISVETYPYAVGLSVDADSTTPIGARCSIPYGVASLLLDGEVYPDSFVETALADPRREALAARVGVSIAPDMAQPVVRGARVAVEMADGTTHRAEVRDARWGDTNGATATELREKFGRLAGPAGPALESAVDGLLAAPNLDALVAALGVRP
jgi:2-methylcitrate dehydratase PrpD